MARQQPTYAKISRHGEMSDWQLYLRLLRYILPYWWVFGLSIFGYVIYSGSAVLLSDIMQFLLDALNESDQVASGKISL